MFSVVVLSGEGGLKKKRAVDGIKRYVAPDNCCEQRLTEVLQMRRR